MSGIWVLTNNPMMIFYHTYYFTDEGGNPMKIFIETVRNLSIKMLEYLNSNHNK